MIDIIIPTYNNKEGLLKTLNSIPNLKELKITIIDDCSTQNIDYSDIEKKYNFIKSPINQGPGLIRQLGIDITHEPYIMFIDTGDYFLPDIFEKIIQTIKKEQFDIYSWKHISEKISSICAETHNRVCGRIYKRDFLNKYNITFSREGSYANEDIGFNRICRLLCKEKLGKVKILDKPICIWTYDINSITNKNNEEFNYKKQNIGLALNGIHIYNTCKNLVSKKTLEDECSEIMGALYRGVIQTAQEAPEFLNEAWRGAKIFFDTIYKLNESGLNSSLYQTFSKIIKEYRANVQSGKWTKSISLNINKFLSDLDKYELPPEWYFN